MRPVEKAFFTVVDIETTGLSAQQHRITEVALLQVEAGKIVSTKEMLINPEQFISPFIAQYTGITNAMVFAKPTFSEVGHDIASFVVPQEKPVIVGHNVRFDHGFLRESYLRSYGPGAPLNALADCDLLCTCRLAKRIYPKMRSHSLGNVVMHLDIPLKKRHRAMGDAEATALLLIHLVDQARENYGIGTVEDLLRFQYARPTAVKPKSKAAKTLREQVSAFPERPGVYYMCGSTGTVLYVGKAKNLRDRVSSYFTTSAARANSKVGRMMKVVKEIKYEEAGSELSAMLMESRKIKELKPRFNSLDKRYKSYTFLRIDSNEEFPRLDSIKWPAADGADYYGPFRSRKSVEALIEVLNRAFQLRECDGPLKVDPGFKPCFYYDIKRCAAPCAGLQTQSEYALEVDRFRSFMTGGDDGIIHLVERMIQKAADELNFEDAQFLKLRWLELRRVLGAGGDASTTLNTKNCVILAPALAGAVEVFFVRFGRLIKQRAVNFATRDELETWFTKQLRMYYGSTSAIPPECGRPEIDEMRIISTWLDRQHREGASVTYLGDTPEEALPELIRACSALLGLAPVSSNAQKEVPKAEPPPKQVTFTEEAVRTAKRLTLRPMTMRKI